jgi:hypothetical protein
MLTPRSIPGEFVSPRILRHAPSCYILVTMRAADGGYAPRFLSIFLALGFSRFDGESTLPPTAANAPRSTFRKLSLMKQTSNMPKFSIKVKSNEKVYQRPGTIGLYYFAFVFLMVILTVPVGNEIRFLEESGFTNVGVISYTMNSALMIDVFIFAIALLASYNETSKLKESQIARRTRMYYLIPIVSLLMGFVAGIGAWMILQSRSIVVPAKHENSFFLLGLLVSFVAIWASVGIEKLLFKDKAKNKTKNAQQSVLHDHQDDPGTARQSRCMHWMLGMPGAHTVGLGDPNRFAAGTSVFA